MRGLALVGICVCSAFLLNAADSKLTNAEVSRASAALAQLPLRFEENRGQFDPGVRYGARAGAFSLQLSPRGASIVMPGAGRVELGMLHSNPSPKMEPLDRLPARINYFVGGRDQWRTGIASYSRVRYRGVYPGIDVVYYGSRNSLEYDFVVQPGADPRLIRLKFRGGARAGITAEGDLALDFQGRLILQKRPIVYQEAAASNGILLPAGAIPTGSARREVAGRYVLLGRNQVGLHLGDYDHTRPLVIDPALVYCTYLGSSGTDQVRAVKLDSKGRLYIAGSTTTGEIPAIDGAYNNNNAGLTDIFLAILDTTSANQNFPLTYFTYLGGSNLDIPLALDVDSHGVVYLTGSTTSTNFPMAGNSVQTVAGSVQQAFVAAIDPAIYGGDSLVYSTFLGGVTAANSTTGTNTGRGIAVGKDGMIYVIGTTQCTDFPVTGSAYAGVLYGPQDAFLSKIDPNSSTLAYSTYLGGELDDEGRDIAVGSNGLVYFAATTNSTQFPMEGPGYRQTQPGPVSIIVGLMDMTKSGTPSLVYSTYFGGSAVDDVRKIALDSKGRVILTGYTLSTDFPATADAMQSQAGGNGDVFVSVVDPNDPPHFLTYSTYLGGSQGEVAYDVTGDTSGNIYVTGYTLSPDFPVKEAPQANWGGGVNVFIAKLQPGTAGRTGLLFSTYFGAGGVYSGNGVAAGPDGSIYAVGYGTVGLPSSAQANGYSGGVSDGFLIVVK